MNTLKIEKMRKEDLLDAILIYDNNYNLKTNMDKLYKDYEKIYNNLDYHNIVAKLDGKIVGMATIVINHDIVEELKPFLTVWNLGVHQDYRRMKIGTKIINYIYEFAKKNNCSFIALLAEKNNVIGQKFYESLGYYKQVGYVKLINK